MNASSWLARPTTAGLHAGSGYGKRCVTTKAIIYLRSSTGNRDQIRRRETHCREYLDERDLTDAGTITDTGHPQEGLTNLLDPAAAAGTTEVVVSDLIRLGRKPLDSMRHFDIL